MKIYLISSDYEGCAELAFSTAELAENYLIAREDLHSDVVAVTLDSPMTPDEYPATPLLDAMRKAWSESQTRETALFIANYACEYCGAGWKSCDCHAETACGDFGGVTKRGTACLNTVSKREATPCHLHR